MGLRSTVKLLLPSFLLNWLRKIRYKKECKACYAYDAKRFTQYSNSFYKWDSSEKLIGQIVAEYHVIEKGLTMPNMKLGFGIDMMKSLIEHCKLYRLHFNNTNEQFLHALGVIAEYRLFHERNNYVVNEMLVISIDELLSQSDCSYSSPQLAMSRDDYFKFSYASFEDFSSSRHSLRNFSGTIDVGLLEKAVRLSQNAPSACNRQPSRVYIIQDKKIIKQILALQTGNRGFGHLADKLVILTGELGGFLSLSERNDVFLNVGIYAMNLLYALHYYQIGTCALNWCSMPDQDQKLRRICDIIPSENVILIIACGGVPDKFKIALSYRNDYLSILRIR